MATFGFLRPRYDNPAREDPPVAAPPQALPLPADLGTQLEDLVVSVWREEDLWRIEDRINLAVKLAARRPC